MLMETKEGLRQKIASLQVIPSIPAVVLPLLHYLDKPIDQQDVHWVAQLIGQDKSLSAQALHMANSALFGGRQKIDSIQGAVMALGLQRMRDITVSCCMFNILPARPGQTLDPVVFWEHSLGCALVSRRLARKIGFVDPEKAYLSGLLHDLGVVATLWVAPEQFKQAYELARSQEIPLHEAERSVLGITHSESGALLGERWGLGAEINEVLAHHHHPENATQYQAEVAIVSLSDLLCRMCDLGYGFPESRMVQLTQESGFKVLEQHLPSIRSLDWARLTFELDGYMDEVKRLVTAFYRG